MVPNQIIGIIFAIISIGILAYLFKTGKFSRKTGYIFMVLAMILGFLIFSPMFPVQIQELILGESNGVPFMMPLILFSIIVLLALVLGRSFCGYLCPIGAVQELAYLLPGKKYLKGYSKETMLIRGIFFVAILVAGIIFSLGLVGILGPASFFKMNYLVPSFWIFVGILVVSIFVYRPFCRTACPYGVFLSLAASKSSLKLRRNDKCIDCGKCEKVCPTGQAGRDDSKAECYLCTRCVEVCPVDGLEYSK